MAASAGREVRTTLLYGGWAVSEQPAVCAWKRKAQERGFLAPKRSRMTEYHRRRAARYLAISSKKSLWALKKNERRGAKESISRPRRRQSSTYSMPSRRVKANSWMAVEPASRM